MRATCSAPTPTGVAHEFDVLRTVPPTGWDYHSIDKTVLVIWPALAGIDAFLVEVAEYAALGATEVQTMPDRHPVEFTEQIAPRLARLG